MSSIGLGYLDYCKVILEGKHYKYNESKLKKDLVTCSFPYDETSVLTTCLKYMSSGGTHLMSGNGR